MPTDHNWVATPVNQRVFGFRYFLNNEEQGFVYLWTPKDAKIAVWAVDDAQGRRICTRPWLTDAQSALHDYLRNPHRSAPMKRKTLTPPPVKRKPINKGFFG